ncbi:uncharacterized protein LOC123219350 isoform X2 [Mangifera indica]|uniref:uncharacterized protein LOC123219350 isoform X2 n=1 Tax=Mangifera indica TaxID=29780 RepID=UPI001CFBD585|nr:uncharacterized protein LOC123219350 isoform X2 [Mangifera indica]
MSMKSDRPWKLLRRNSFSDGVKCGVKMKQVQLMGIICTVMLFIVYRTTYYQYKQTEMESILNPFDTVKEFRFSSQKLKGLPHGIIQARSDLELKPLWSTNSTRSKLHVSGNCNLLAIPVGIKLKDNVDSIVQKFLPENFTIILFHYDGNINGWWNLDWSDKAIHIVAQNQTKWWFAKRFLHPDVVSIYDYIFLWDEDLGVENFDPGRRVYDSKGSVKCTKDSEGPPCTGFVEGMAPVFSRSAWFCAWHLIQNDLVHGWGMDMKLGYCAQGDRTKNVGIIDSEYVVHQGIQTLGGGPPLKKATKPKELIKKIHAAPVDPRAEIRRQSTWELEMFKKRWKKAVEDDKAWVDPFQRSGRHRTESLKDE